VAGQSSPGVAVVSFLSSEGPDDDTLVPGGGEDQVRVVKRAGDGGNPSGVTLEHSTKHQSFCHGFASKICRSNVARTRLPAFVAFRNGEDTDSVDGERIVPSGRGSPPLGFGVLTLLGQNEGRRLPAKRERAKIYIVGSCGCPQFCKN
jgi:hypothetical protein